MKFEFLASLDCSSFGGILSHPPPLLIFICKAGLGPVMCISPQATEALQQGSYLFDAIPE